MNFRVLNFTVWSILSFFYILAPQVPRQGSFKLAIGASVAADGKILKNFDQSAHGEVFLNCIEKILILSIVLHLNFKLTWRKREA